MATESTTPHTFFNPMLPWQWAAAAWRQWFELAATMVPGMPTRQKAVEQDALDRLMFAQALATQGLDAAQGAAGAGRTREEAPMAAEQAANDAKAPRRRSARVKTGTRRQAASSKPRAHRGNR